MYKYAVRNEVLLPTYFKTQKDAFKYAETIGGKVLIERKCGEWINYWFSEKGYLTGAECYKPISYLFH